jgi:hypothetical protein
MHRMETVLAVLVLLLLTAPMPAHSQSANEDLTPCGAARPEPSQSATWGVLFCNRTGHDLVVQFHDNDCPADNGNRRGDVYEKKIARGEAVTVFLCYAHETQRGANPPPGVPLVRIPGGKGVVTTWNVVGDCGDRSDRPHLDARTFYDRGTYETGIILLQYPAGTAHCFGGPAEAAANPGTGPVARSNTVAPPAAPPAPAAAAAPAAPASTVSAPPAAPSLQVAAPTLNGGPPALAATVDPTNRFTRIVQVFATSAPDAPDYRCKVLLAVTFSDGTNWNDKQQIDVRAGTQNALVLTRKYLKTVTQVTMDSPRCERH